MAQLLTQLIFAPAEPRRSLHALPDGHALVLPACFLQHFCFPCKVQPLSSDKVEEKDNPKRHAQVLQAVLLALVMHIPLMLTGTLLRYMCLLLLHPWPASCGVFFGLHTCEGQVSMHLDNNSME